MQIRGSLIALSVFAALSACNSHTGADSGDSPDPEASSASGKGPSETVSILRADIEQPDLAEPILEPLKVTIGFPEGGAELDAAALFAVQEVLASQQITEGGLIVLRGHSDAGGSDSVNERASHDRAERVSDWLIENDVAANRIQIIAFGEQNPIEPNALSDGSPNEEGRALNRRVEVLVVPKDQDVEEASASTDGAAEEGTPISEIG